MRSNAIFLSGKITEIGRIIELHGQRARIYSGNEELDAVLSGKLRLDAFEGTTVSVGDFVQFMRKDETATIEKVLERKSTISKPAVERGGFKQVLISNIDRILIVTSVSQPKFNHGIVERFLIVAFKEKITPVVVLNKIDLGDSSKYDTFLDAWRNISCRVFKTSARTGEGIELLKDEISKGTSVVAGHSGVGKSSILNRISPGLNIRTKNISSYSKRGVHTTSRVSLHKITEEGWVADTPGLKILGFSEINQNDLQEYFPDFDNHRHNCRFIDCHHINEPECGVKAAVAAGSGSIAEFRYKSYLRIYESLGKNRIR